MNLPIPDMGTAERAADLLIPHIEEEWLDIAKRGSCTMAINATVYPDVLPAITSGRWEEAWQAEKWICDPAALRFAIQARLPAGFKIEFASQMTPTGGIGHCYFIRYTGTTA